MFSHLNSIYYGQKRNKSWKREGKAFLGTIQYVSNMLNITINLAVSIWEYQV